MSCQLTNILEVSQKNTRLNNIFQVRVRILRIFKRNFIFLKNRISGVLRLRSKMIDAKEYGNANVRSGDIVTVRSKEDIWRMLDDREKYKGCFFIDEMYEHCDKEYKVLKTVDYFFDEFKQKMCKCRDAVILDGVVCSGRQRLYSVNCDRSCFFFWHTAWLKKER